MEMDEKPSETKSKTILGSKKSLFGPFYAIPFYIGKVQFPTYPNVFKHKYLELGIEF